MLLSATTLSAGIIYYPVPIKDDNSWHWIEVTADDPTAQFTLDLTNPLKGAGYREVRVTDAFTSGDTYWVEVAGGMSMYTSPVSNDPAKEIDQSSNDPDVLANAAWLDSLLMPGRHFSSGWFTLLTGRSYTISITRYQWATACQGPGHPPGCTMPPDLLYPYGTPYGYAGVFIFVDPPADGTGSPESATFALIGLGLSGLALASRRFRH